MQIDYMHAILHDVLQDLKFCIKAMTTNKTKECLNRINQELLKYIFVLKTIIKFYNKMTKINFKTIFSLQNRYN